MEFADGRVVRLRTATRYAGKLMGGVIRRNSARERRTEAWKR